MTHVSLAVLISRCGARSAFGADGVHGIMLSGSRQRDTMEPPLEKYAREFWSCLRNYEDIKMTKRSAHQTYMVCIVEQFLDSHGSDWTVDFVRDMCKEWNGQMPHTSYYAPALWAVIGQWAERCCPKQRLSAINLLIANKRGD